MIGGDTIRKFIISDIHGVGNIYYSIMGYLDNLAKTDEITLYINGDLFDRGLESAEILLDMINRIRHGSYKIEYLAGNHELMMFDCFERRKKNLYNASNLWYLNGGKVTDDGLDDLLDCNDKAILEVSDFISNLKIYHKFEERIGQKQIVLVHAQCPFEVEDECNLKLSGYHFEIEHYVWTREYEPDFPIRFRIGNKNYFTIIGHTPNNNSFGYEYHENGNYLNIDGGCSMYAGGCFEYDHVPLVEVMDEKLKILTFNNNNEIVAGNYFFAYESVPMSEKRLEEERKLLDSSYHPKKLVKLPNNKMGYE